MSREDLRLDTPFVRTDSEGQIISATDHKGAAHLSNYFTSLRNGPISVPSTIASHSEETIPGSLEEDGLFDVIPYDLTAGTTYTFALRSAATDGIEDPWLQLHDPNGNLIAFDDDGGAGRSSLITFTPTQSGSYLLLATSWFHVATTETDLGNYTVDVWTFDPAHDAGDTVADATIIAPGTTFGYLDAPGDVDVYSINLTEGMYYTFGYAGGIADGSDWDGEAGENIGILELLDADGNVIAANLNFESTLSLFAEESGAFYVRVTAYDPGSKGNAPPQPELPGGYTLDVQEVDPADEDPVDSIRWVDAANVPFVNVNGVPTAYVYFASSSENFGETNDHGGPMNTLGWNDYEIQQVMLALEQYEHILGVNYEITTDPEQATFRLLTTRSDLYGAYAYPQDPAYGTQQGILVFNVDSGGWDFDQQQSLEQGGFAFAVILHEFGHAHGLAHPHDNGGGSDVMLGVTAATGSFGVYDLNQGVYTVMSYNDAWELHPDGPSPFTGAGIDNGWSGTLSAFDIAALQDRYGVHAYNTGNNVYQLAGVENDAFYQTIWDTGGTDSIQFGGNADARIDLLAATLDYSPTGGGAISFVSGIHGGYTIANGVVIENATGGGGNDVLLGNSAGNVLTGNGGNDTLMGRTGNDTLNGSAGSDTASYANASGGVTVNLKNGTGRGADGFDTLISIENAVGSASSDTLTGSDGANRLDGGAGNDTLNGGKGIDTYVFADAGTDTIIGYQSGEDIDLSSLGVTFGDVSILSDRIVVDLAGEDLAIKFNTAGFSTSDLIFGDAAASSISSLPAPESFGQPKSTHGSFEHWGHHGTDYHLV